MASRYRRAHQEAGVKAEHIGPLTFRIRHDTVDQLPSSSDRARFLRHPENNASLIWFTVWSSVVHAAVMAVQSLQGKHHTGHLWGDVPALLLAAVVLAVLVRSSGLASRDDRSPREVP